MIDTKFNESINEIKKYRDLHKRSMQGDKEAIREFNEWNYNSIVVGSDLYHPNGDLFDMKRMLKKDKWNCVPFTIFNKEIDLYDGTNPEIFMPQWSGNIEE